MPSASCSRDWDELVWPRITVVTPSYNQAAFLEETIRSVLLQDYPNLEYIVIDGGSTDGSVAILQRYAPWISYWASESDSGQAAAINKGFRRATGSVLGWVNSDDILAEGALRVIGSEFAGRADVDVVCGFRRTAFLESKRLRAWVYPEPTASSLRCYSYLPQETVFFRKHVYTRAGAIDEGLVFALDYEYWLRVQSAGFDFHLIPQFLSVFRYHRASKSFGLRQVRTRELNSIYRRHLGRETSEESLKRELGVRWWASYYALKTLARARVLDNSRIASAAVRALSAIANSGRLGPG